VSSIAVWAMLQGIPIATTTLWMAENHDRPAVCFNRKEAKTTVKRQSGGSALQGRRNAGRDVITPAEGDSRVDGDIQANGARRLLACDLR